MTILLMICVSVVIATIVSLCRNYFRILYYSFQFPGPVSYPLIGNAMWFLNKNPVEILLVFKELFETYGNFYRLWLGPNLLLTISDPKLAEVVFSSSILIDKSDEYSFLKEWLGDGLLLSKGKKWVARRKALTPAFHFKILEQFIGVFDKQAVVLIQNLKTHCNGETFDILHLISLYALDVICETSMGTTTNAQTNSDSEYVRAVKTMTNILYIRMLDPLMRSPYFYLTAAYKKQKEAIKILHDYTDAVIVSRRTELLLANETGKKEREKAAEDYDIGIKKKMALLDVLLQTDIDGQPLTNLEIREEVDTFMFEGHDTTTSGICFILYNIAKYPEVQKKLISEIHSVFDENLNRTTTMNDLNKLQYMELVIKESLRLFPPVPMIGRKVNEDFILDGMLVPAGINIGLGPIGIHRNKNYYENHLDFIPERFEAEMSTENINPYRFVPFSAGPRNCIGQKFAMLEMKSVISKIVRSYEIQLPTNAEDPVLVAELILRTENGIQIQIKERKN